LAASEAAPVYEPSLEPDWIEPAEEPVTPMAAEIAAAVAFLASAKNTYITGQTIAVDGGYTCL